MWGSHVANELREQSPASMAPYAINVDRSLSLVGHKELRDDMAYVGHLVNDGARLDGLGGWDLKFSLPAYMEASGEAQNCGQETVAGCHTVTLATRDISAGEELLATYGGKYWMGALRRRNDHIGQVLSAFF